MFKTEHRGMYAYRYRSDDGGKTWTFLSSQHENVSARLATEAYEQAAIQREFK
jgi:hypothetical protein